MTKWQRTHSLSRALPKTYSGTWIDSLVVTEWEQGRVHHRREEIVHRLNASKRSVLVLLRGVLRGVLRGALGTVFWRRGRLAALRFRWRLRCGRRRSVGLRRRRRVVRSRSWSLSSCLLLLLQPGLRPRARSEPRCWQAGGRRRVVEGRARVRRFVGRRWRRSCASSTGLWCTVIACCTPAAAFPATAGLARVGLTAAARRAERLDITRIGWPVERGTRPLRLRKELLLPGHSRCCIVWLLLRSGGDLLTALPIVTPLGPRRFLLARSRGKQLLLPSQVALAVVLGGRRSIGGVDCRRVRLRLAAAAAATPVPARRRRRRICGSARIRCTILGGCSTSTACFFAGHPRNVHLA